MCTARTTNRGRENAHIVFHLLRHIGNQCNCSKISKLSQLVPHESFGCKAILQKCLLKLSVSVWPFLVCTATSCEVLWPHVFLCSLEVLLHMCSSPWVFSGFLPLSFCFPLRECHLGDRILLHFLLVTPVFITTEHLMSKCLWEINLLKLRAEKILLNNFFQHRSKSLSFRFCLQRGSFGQLYLVQKKPLPP